MSGAYYNEIDPFAVRWLRNLMDAGLIAPGDIDPRDIRDVKPIDIKSYTQCHFFAGIGVWSYALRLAGWPDDRPIWTGSCPCQPFSAAGAGLGFADERHLWPHWFHLIRECGASTILGEQVASKDAGPWLDLVQNDVESLGHAFGAIAFPSAGIGAPHIRDRLYWMADTLSARRPEWGSGTGGGSTTGVRGAGGVAYPLSEGRGQIGRNPESDRETGAGRARDWHGYGSTHVLTPRMVEPAPAGPTNGFWRDADWLLCRDGKWRPVEPGTFPLAHGAAARVGRLRAYGNAINARAAAEFIRWAKEAIEEIA